MIVATFDSANFSFIALGTTKEDAEQALLDGWQRHLDQYTDADPTMMAQAIEEGDVNYIRLAPGQVARDGEVMNG